MTDFPLLAPRGRVDILHMAEKLNGRACAFSRCGAQLAVCGADGEVKIWESATGTLKQRFKAANVAITCLSWSRHTKVRPFGMVALTTTH